MSLANLLSAEQIIPEMKATERWSAIVELIDLLVSLGKIKPADRDPILAALKATGGDNEHGHRIRNCHTALFIRSARRSGGCVRKVHQRDRVRRVG